jgi:hypothetical protein
MQAGLVADAPYNRSMGSLMYELTRIHTGRQLTPLASQAAYHCNYWPNMDSKEEAWALGFAVATGNFCDDMKVCITEGFAIHDGEAADDVVLMDLSELEQELTDHMKKLEANGLYAYATIAPRPIRTLDGYDFADCIEETSDDELSSIIQSTFRCDMCGTN